MKKIFYSWQSDLSNKTNRGLIVVCLKQAVKSLDNNELALAERPELDKDTQGKSGSPNIAESIFEKIDTCNVFVADVSIINKDKNCRSTPNPNVLIELGYAAKAVGWENIICVFNTESGDLNTLPFDIRSRRILSYNLGENCGNKSDVRKELANDLKLALSDIFKGVIPKLARDLMDILYEIDPNIITAILNNQLQIKTLIPASNFTRIEQLFQNINMKKLAQYTIGTDMISNDPRGVRNDYHFFFTPLFKSEVEKYFRN